MVIVKSIVLKTFVLGIIYFTTDIMPDDIQNLFKAL